jgi:DNA-binding CsgD family transcriptional regulator
MAHFYGRPDRDLGGPFSEAIKNNIGVDGTIETLKKSNVSLSEMRRSDWFNLIRRPLNVELGIRLVVRHAHTGRGLGALSIQRSPGESWTEDEGWELARLEPFLMLALSEYGNADATLTDSGRQGEIIADPAGKPLFFSAEGRRLLYLATHPRIAPDTKFRSAPELPPPVAKLCRNLARIFADDGTAPAPIHYHRNVWGGFRFTARWLEGADRACNMVAISIVHQEPINVRLVRRLGELPLSRRQAEVCFLLASGASNETVAQALGISRHTAIAHGRWIYNKLDVHNKAELVNKLLAPAG